jgi:hypothetical protein
MLRFAEAFSFSNSDLTTQWKAGEETFCRWYTPPHQTADWFPRPSVKITFARVRHRGHIRRSFVVRVNQSLAVAGVIATLRLLFSKVGVNEWYGATVGSAPFSCHGLTFIRPIFQ